VECRRLLQCSGFNEHSPTTRNSSLKSLSKEAGGDDGMESPLESYSAWLRLLASFSEHLLSYISCQKSLKEVLDEVEALSSNTANLPGTWVAIC
jgi:hypothetical protein